MQTTAGVRFQRTFPLFLALIALAALAVRVVPLYDRVFTPQSVRFQSVDPYYHVRLSTYLTEHFPHRLEYDPLRLHPDGQRVDVYPAYDLLNATLAQVVGLGAPSERTTEAVIAWTPPLLGTATVAIVGVSVHAMAGPWAGLAAAFVAAFLPGGNLTQTVLGFSDHHALESFFLALAWWLLALWLKADGSAGRRLWTSALLGVTVAGYTLTWEGGPVLPAVIGVCSVIAVIVHAADPAAQRRIAVGSSVAAAAALGVSVFMQFSSPMVTISVALLCLMAATPLIMLMLQRAVGVGSPDRLRVTWLSILLFGIAAAAWLTPDDLRHALLTNLRRFDPSEQAQTVSELRPLISDPELVWNYFGVSIGWALAGMVLAAMLARRHRDLSWVVPLATGGLFMPAALLQTRFAAAASLPIAWLNGIVLAELLRRNGVAGSVPSWVRGALVVAWLGSVAIWSAWSARVQTSIDRGPSVDWMSTTRWLAEDRAVRDTTNGDGGGDVRRPGVLNWWDSGYYLTSLAGLPPVSNPTQAGARLAAEAFLDTSGERGVARLARAGIGYIVAEAALSLRPTSETSIAGQFPALPIWAKQDRRSFVREVYFPRANGILEPRYAYLPAYYRSLLIRLLLTDGGASTPRPRAAWAIQLERRIVDADRSIDVVRSSRSFASAEAVEAFLRSEADSTWLIVGFSPFEPCVALEPVRNVRLVHSSPTTALAHPSLPRPIPMLKVFVVRDGESGE